MGLSPRGYESFRATAQARTGLSSRLTYYGSIELPTRRRQSGTRHCSGTFAGARVLLDRRDSWIGMGRRCRPHDQGGIGRRHSLAPGNLVPGWAIRNAGYSRCRASTGVPGQLDSTGGEGRQAIVSMDLSRERCVRPRCSLDWTSPSVWPYDHAGVASSGIVRECSMATCGFRRPRYASLLGRYRVVPRYECEESSPRVPPLRNPSAFAARSCGIQRAASAEFVVTARGVRRCTGPVCEPGGLIP
jgi:hypothetical protein